MCIRDSSQIAAVSEDIQLTVIPSVGVENVPEEKWEEINAVSYTHLDVYKRQR